jgi:hypothetical protein
MIIKENGKYFVKSGDGSKNLGGPYESRKAAVKRLQQVEFFKHKNKSDGGVIEKENFFERINKMLRENKKK